MQIFETCVHGVVVAEPAASACDARDDFMVTARVKFSGLVEKVITPFGGVAVFVLVETLVAEAISVEIAFDMDAEFIGSSFEPSCLVPKYSCNSGC